MNEFIKVISFKSDNITEKTGPVKLNTKSTLIHPITEPKPTTQVVNAQDMILPRSK